MTLQKICSKYLKKIPQMILKYGNNPHQLGYIEKCKHSNIKVLNGKPSYINYLDAIHSWDLVSSIKEYKYDNIIATSFKHNIPTGLVSIKNSSNYFNNPVKESFLQSRNIDPLSSFGDFIAISDYINSDTALKIKNVVSDGIIANGFSDNAFNILKSKKKGNYIICKGTHFYKYDYDIRELNGIRFVTQKNNYILDNEKLDELLHKNNLYDSINNNLTIRNNLQLSFNILRNITSNSVSIAYDNKVIAVGSGQQNRLDCIKLAGKKAMKYLERNNINKDDVELVLGSDGFLPFEDNIEECLKYNIKYIIQPGGSVRDYKVNELCNKYNIKMIHTGIRMFYH